MGGCSPQDDEMFEKGDLVRLKIKKVADSQTFSDLSLPELIDIEIRMFNERHYWDVRDGDLGVVLDDNYGPKATHQLVYFASSKRGAINIKRDDLEKVNAQER